MRMPHQWTQGNLPVHAKCVVCNRPCGSVRRLQDYYCLWCHSTVSSFTVLSSVRTARTIREREREFISQMNKQIKQIQISTVAGYTIP